MRPTPLPPSLFSPTSLFSLHLPPFPPPLPPGCRPLYVIPRPGAAGVRREGHPNGKWPAVIFGASFAGMSATRARVFIGGDHAHNRTQFITESLRIFGRGLGLLPTVFTHLRFSEGTGPYHRTHFLLTAGSFARRCPHRAGSYAEAPMHIGAPHTNTVRGPRAAMRHGYSHQNPTRPASLTSAAPLLDDFPRHGFNPGDVPVESAPAKFRRRISNAAVAGSPSQQLAMASCASALPSHHSPPAPTNFALELSAAGKYFLA